MPVGVVYKLPMQLQCSLSIKFLVTIRALLGTAQSDSNILYGAIA